MSQYRYLTTDLITGELLGDWLPIEAQSFSRTINTSATATVSLILNDDDKAANIANLAAVVPRKSVLWVLQDNAVIWGGPIWDWNHQSASDGTLPLGCSSMDSVMQYRVVSDTITYTNMDIFDMVRGLITYAVTKTVPYCSIAGLTMTQGESGIRDTVTFDGTQYQLVSDALTTLIQTYEIEISWRPYQDAEGNFKTNVDMAYPYLGTTFPESGLVYNFPGNLIDYAFQATGSAAANVIYATATDDSGNNDTTLTGFAEDHNDINAGFPRMEMSLSAQVIDWTTNAQVTNYAYGYLPQVTDTQLTPVLTLPGGVYPKISQTVLGSAAQMSLTSALHPAGAGGSPGFTGVGRVTGWTVTPPSGGGQAETATVTMGDMTLANTAIPVAPPPVPPKAHDPWFF